LPNRLQHVGMKVSGTDLCANINQWCHLLLIQTCFEGQAPRWCVVLLGVSWKVLWYSAKEYSRTFYEAPWGLLKDMFTNTQGQSDIVTHKTTIWNKVYLCKRTFSTASLFRYTLPLRMLKVTPVQLITPCNQLKPWKCVHHHINCCRSISYNKNFPCIWQLGPIQKHFTTVNFVVIK
jgi:hypothetical protein